MRRVRFLLAIDSYLVRKGLVYLLNRQHGVSVVGEFETIDPLIQYTNKHGTDFLIISQNLFNNSIDLFLSESGLLDKTILLKGDHSEEESKDVHASINLLEKKENIIQKITELLELHTTHLERSKTGALTQRELTILKWVAMGMTNKQIAEELFLSTHTVITHRKNISSKLGIKSVSGLTVYAIVNNIITIEEVSSKPSQ